MNDKIFAEAELEFTFEDAETATGLEYATVHYLANDYLTLSAGKFLVPFGVFGQRLHPSWINRFNSLPPFFGHHGGIPGLDPLIPVIGDIGAMAGVVAPLHGVGRSLTFSAYATSGPRAEDAMAGMAEERPEFAFGEFTGDDNDAKMFGGRVGLVLAPHFEVDVSALRSKWGEGMTGPTAGESLFFTGYDVAAEYRPIPGLELRTEWVWLRTDVEDTTGTTPTIETVPQFGAYAQVSYRYGAWEPVFRLGLVNSDQDETDTRLTQYGFGLNYWLWPSVSVAAGFELNRDHFNAGSDLPNNRFLARWAFGF